jgi:hypothetical protein
LEKLLITDAEKGSTAGGRIKGSSLLSGLNGEEGGDMACLNGDIGSIESFGDEGGVNGDDGGEGNMNTGLEGL